MLSEPDPEDVVATADSLSTAFLLLLETLSPVERAVFLLREAFGYTYDEIADVVGRTEANCRQIFARARQRIDAGRPRFTVSREERDAAVEKFIAACQRGDIKELVQLLAEDATFYSDGGGKVAAASEPILGRDRVVRMLKGLINRARQRNLRLAVGTVNGQSGGVVLDPQGHVVNVVSFDVRGGVVATIWSVANPDKLRHLTGP